MWPRKYFFPPRKSLLAQSISESFKEGLDPQLKKYTVVTLARFEDDLHSPAELAGFPAVRNKSLFSLLKSSLFVHASIMHSYIIISFDIHVPNRVRVHLYLSGLVKFSTYKTGHKILHGCLKPTNTGSYPLLKFSLLMDFTSRAYPKRYSHPQ